MALGWLLATTACTHNLDKLRGPHVETGGQPAPDQPKAGGADAAMPVDKLASCRPCRPPTGLSDLVLPAACCTGVNDTQCGVAFGASECFARHAPGLPDTSCPDLMRAGLKFAGCCRFDEQCGVSLDELELGCLARDGVPPALGGPLAPRACVPKCDGDLACRPLTDLARCVEDATHRAESRFCAYSCSTDKDCSALPGTVCAIQPNKTELRIDSVCRKPFGPGLLGDTCANTNDCAHGVCLQAASSYCSELCRTDLECVSTGSQCKTSVIPLPAPASGTQSFSVCVAK